MAERKIRVGVLIFFACGAIFLFLLARRTAVYHAGYANLTIVALVLWSAAGWYAIGGKPVRRKTKAMDRVTDVEQPIDPDTEYKLEDDGDFTRV